MPKKTDKPKWLPLFETVEFEARRRGFKPPTRKNITGPFYGSRFKHKTVDDVLMAQTEDLEKIYDRIWVKPSGLEKALEMWMILGDHDKSFFEVNSWEPLSPKQADFWWPELNKILEVNGDYWHQDEKRETSKAELAKERGFQYAVVWGSDWVNQRKECEEALRIFLTTDTTPELLTKTSTKESRKLRPLRQPKAQLPVHFKQVNWGLAGLAIVEADSNMEIIRRNRDLALIWHASIGLSLSDYNSKRSYMDAPHQDEDGYCFLCGNFLCWIVSDRAHSDKEALAQWGQWAAGYDEDEDIEFALVLAQHRQEDEEHILDQFCRSEREKQFRGKAILDRIDMLLDTYLG